jgi:hypothetical protein
MIAILSQQAPEFSNISLRSSFCKANLIMQKMDRGLAGGTHGQSGKRIRPNRPCGSSVDIHNVASPLHHQYPNLRGKYSMIPRRRYYRLLPGRARYWEVLWRGLDRLSAKHPSL